MRYFDEVRLESFIETAAMGGSDLILRGKKE